MSAPTVYTAEEAAAIAKVSAATIRRRVAAGHIPAKRVGTRIRILHEDLMRWLRTDETEKPKRERRRFAPVRSEAPAGLDAFNWDALQPKNGRARA